MAAYLTGREAESDAAWERAHQAFVERGEVPAALGCAFWLAHNLLLRGEVAPSSGWVGRGRRLLQEYGGDCVQEGYLLVAAGLHTAWVDGDVARAAPVFSQAGAIGDRFGDTELIAFGRLTEGQALIGLGKAEEGVSLLDEAMVAVTTGQVSPVTTGVVYCPLEAHRACRWLTDPPQAAAGLAFYQRGELHRVRGELAEAAEAYRQASRLGREPQPGLALLRLANGHVEAAEAAIRRVVAEDQRPAERARVLSAAVEILLAVDDVAAARAAAGELAQLTSDVQAPLLQARAAHTEGAVLLADGQPHAACQALRRAWTCWRQLGAPYERAEARMLTGVALRELDDEDTAELEFDAARWIFQQLGARPALARLEALSAARRAPAATGGLTPREVEVLLLVAKGHTNAQIAADLVISEKTVARHLTNIFAKISVSSRAAATAWAYTHDLV